MSQNPLAQVRCVRVGSTNSPKVEAVRSAFRAYAPRARVEGVAVESGVSEQPVGLGEIVRGARNRAEAARSTGTCDFGVGLEDGLLTCSVPEEEVLNVGCAAVSDGARFSLGFSAAFAYPPRCSEPARLERRPIGPLFDRFWVERRGRGALAERRLGNVGKLTLGILPRSDYTRHAVLCALIRFLHPDLYAEDGPSS